MRTLQQRGFTAVEALIIIVLVAIIGVAGYGIYNHKHNVKPVTTTAAKTAAPSTAGPVAATASAPAAINSTSDLDKAQAQLDQTNPSADNTSDTTQLDSVSSGI